MNVLESSGQRVTMVVPIPDHHQSTIDGGIKDVLFLTRPIGLEKPRSWQTATVIAADNESLFGQSTQKVQQLLQEKIATLEQQGHQVDHVVPIIDSHTNILEDLMRTSGISRKSGGLKNMVLCYHQK